MSDPVNAEDLRVQRVRWRWKDRVAEGGLHELAGRPDKGKGIVVAHIASYISKHGGVIISTAEEIPGLMTKPRLEVARARLSNVKFWRLWLPRDFKELSAHVRSEHTKLLVLDPLARHLSNGVNRHTDSMARVLDPLAGLCEDTGLSVLVVDHINKKVSPNEDPLNAISGGSSGMASAARAVYVWGMDPEDPDSRYLATVKCNMRQWHRGEDGFEALKYEIDSDEHPEVGPTPLLIERGPALIDPILLMRRGASQGRPPEAREEAKQWLQTYLSGAKCPVRASIVREDARVGPGISKKTLDNARKDMGVIVNPSGGGAGCTWALNETAGKPELPIEDK